MGDLESALLQQRLVWRFYAILSAVYLVVGGIAVVGILGAMMAR